MNMHKKRRHVQVLVFDFDIKIAYVAYNMVQAHGKENCILIFTDTQWEDDDNYRFMEEVSEYIGVEITYRIDGRTPEEVFYDYRFLGNSRMAKCSEELKVKQTLIFLEELRDEHNLEPILYFGIGPHETHRSDRLKEFYAHNPLEPIETRFPMIEKFVPDEEIKDIIENGWSIKLPRMYELGFTHANCGGRCVRGGFEHYAQLYKIWPHQYQEQEEMEERFRKHFEKNVSILKAEGKPFTLREYRELMERVSVDNVIQNGITKYLRVRDEERESIPCVCTTF